MLIRPEATAATGLLSWGFYGSTDFACSVTFGYVGYWIVFVIGASICFGMFSTDLFANGIRKCNSCTSFEDGIIKFMNQTTWGIEVKPPVTSKMTRNVPAQIVRNARNSKFGGPIFCCFKQVFLFFLNYPGLFWNSFSVSGCKPLQKR